MQDLHDFMGKIDLIDGYLKGNPFTWSNNIKGNELILVRLDRLLVTRWWHQLSSSFLENLPRIAFDYSPLLFKWEDRLKRGPKPFRYKIMWETHPNFKYHIEEWWNIRIDGTTMYRLTQKLNDVRRN